MCLGLRLSLRLSVRKRSRPELTQGARDMQLRTAGPPDRWASPKEVRSEPLRGAGLGAGRGGARLSWVTQCHVTDGAFLGEKRA